MHMNACESARTRDAKDACKTKKIAPRRAAKGKRCESMSKDKFEKTYLVQFAG